MLREQHAVKLTCHRRRPPWLKGIKTSCVTTLVALDQHRFLRQDNGMLLERFGWHIEVQTGLEKRYIVCAIDTVNLTFAGRRHRCTNKKHQMDSAQFHLHVVRVHAGTGKNGLATREIC
jgi:hypothetical protein